MSSSPLTASSVHVEPFYIDGAAGKIFVTCFRPSFPSEHGTTVLCLPPFAEEMNKSRRMLALQGRSLAQNGITFILPDVHGTGDSDGEFADGNWELWCNDIRHVVNWLRGQGVSSIDVLALRLGIFLGADSRGEFQISAKKIAMWSPVLSGSKMLNQLLRAKLVRSMGAPGKNSVAESRDKLKKLGGLEVAGYWLSDKNFESIDRLQLEALRFDGATRIHWQDVSPANVGRIPAKVAEILPSISTDPEQAVYSRVIGPQFWLGPEIETVTELIDSTTDFFVSG